MVIAEPPLSPGVKEIVTEPSAPVAERDVGAAGARAATAAVRSDTPITPAGAAELVAVTTERIKLATSAGVNV